MGDGISKNQDSASFLERGQFCAALTAALLSLADRSVIKMDCGSELLKGQVKWQTIKDIHPLKYIKVIEWV